MIRYSLSSRRRRKSRKQQKNLNNLRKLKNSKKLLTKRFQIDIMNKPSRDGERKWSLKIKQN
ncbi:hypothetical protein, partial [Clostridium botulinum]|uniref:hypothetical protein n=1 Tax=Clostridium botulinum TaxID=1491 RepID=UPI001E3D9529